MGFQSHFDGSPTGITKVLSVIDRYATAFPSMKFKVTEFDVVTDDPHFSRRFYRAALARQALLRPIGTTVYLMPPYIVSDAEIAHLAQAAAGALAEALAGKG